jgi:hypothetical protein
MSTWGMQMTDPTLTTEFPWLRRDAAPILGDSRPRSYDELLGKDRLWMQLYMDWLHATKPDYDAGLKYLLNSKTRRVEYSARLQQSYPDFYKAAGRLKDAVRKNAAAARTEFPWAPANAAGLLGDARPRNFEDLADGGSGSSWVAAYRGWLEQEEPFDSAAAWLDWLLGQEQSAQEWKRELDPTVEAFAHDIGRLKERLRETHGNRAQRAFRQVGEAVDEVNRFAQRAGFIDPSQPVSGDRAPAGQQPMAQRPAGQQPAGQRPAGQRPPTPPRRSTARPGVQKNISQAVPLIAGATELGRWVGWLGGRFTACGGVLAQETANLQAYQQLIERDGGSLREQVTAARDQLAAGSDDVLFRRLGAVRDAVYSLAWNVDLAYQNYYGGWPHQRVGTAIQALEGAGPVQLRSAVSGMLTRLLAEVDSIYEAASSVLDVALTAITEEVPGYPGEDSAQVWGAHEMVGARAELAALSQQAGAWAGEQPAADEDEDTLDAAAQAAFGLSYQSLVQAAGQFQ